MRIPWWATRPLLALVIAGCAGVPADVGPTSPPRPDVPAGWRTVTTDEGDVEATIPRAFVVTGTTGAISGYPEVDAPPSASWMAIGPATHELRSGQTIEDWIDESHWLTAQREGAQLGAIERDELLLPAGPALEFSAVYTADGREAWTILYAIDVGGELSVIRFGGDGPLPNDLPDDFALIRDLLVFPRN